MRFEGVLRPPTGKDKYWSVAVPSLGIYTQGRSRADALFMICDAVQIAADRKGFKAKIEEDRGRRFSISGNDPNVMISILLTRKRSEAGLSIRDVARRLKMRSPNGYAKYEKGEVSISVDQFERLLRAIDPKARVFLRVG
jgi:predicted RNase H-like HicB family nuclease